MYVINCAGGAVRPLYRDGAQNETHLFPDERFGLEESNRASDPAGKWRGVSSISVEGLRQFLPNLGITPPSLKDDETYAPHGPMTGFDRPFDLYVVPASGGGAVRRLTDVNEAGVNAHQSVPAPDGHRIAFAINTRTVKNFRHKTGLYIGTFAGNGE